MKHLIKSLILVLAFSNYAQAAAKVMNPGKATGQLVILSSDDVINESPKFKSLNPLSIPVFAELPMDLSVIAGSITLKQQNLLSHVQLKSRARNTPNLDISNLDGGMKNALLANLKDGQWIQMELIDDSNIRIVGAADEAQSLAFQEEAAKLYEAKRSKPVTLKSNTQETKIFTSAELTSEHYVVVGSKSANYAELARLLNSPERVVVRPGYGIPFYYYDQFINVNPEIKKLVDSVLIDPMMKKIGKVSYRENKLKALQAQMMKPEMKVDAVLLDQLLKLFNSIRDEKGLAKKIKLRSSTNSEDLPNFNGAGLYTSVAYKPITKNAEGKKVEMSDADKRIALAAVLREVWASVWNIRAFDERNYFQIPHAQVKMGIQVNPTFGNEIADGVVVTKNVGQPGSGPDSGVYIEVQRGDKHSVANPNPNVRPQKILVTYNAARPNDANQYAIKIMQNSNIGDNDEILAQDNPKPVMTEADIKDLVFQVLKARAGLKPKLDADNKNFALDLEFKVDSAETGTRKVFLKQARPYID